MKNRIKYRFRALVVLCFILLLAVLFIGCGSSKRSKLKKTNTIEQRDLQEIEISSKIEKVFLNILEKYKIESEQKLDSVVTSPDGTKKEYGKTTKTNIDGEVKTTQNTDSEEQGVKIDIDKGNIETEEFEEEIKDRKGSNVFTTIGVVFSIAFISFLIIWIKRKFFP